MDEAWPALESVRVGAWKARFGAGVTKRANSVLCPDGSEDGDIAAVERLYAERELPAVFQLRPGALDDELARRGYTLVDPTLFFTRRLTAADVRTGPVEVSDEPGRAWMDAWWAVDGRYAEGLPVAREILTGVQARYASVTEDGRAVATGRGVPQGDTLGVYCMAVPPEQRRRGLARVVLRALLADAYARGQRTAYLAVTEANAAARALYTAEGFVPAGGYHYRVSSSGRA